MTNAGFLPDAYEQPKTGGGYLKLKKGENKIRILSKPIVGWLDWKDNKPIRTTHTPTPPSPIDPAKKVKHFWAFIVWDYVTEEVKIMEITQSSIMTAITTLANDKEWGSPFGFDLKISRKGDGMETEYSVVPSPHKEATQTMADAFHAKRCDLNLLFTGGDPFSATTNYTGMFNSKS